MANRLGDLLPGALSRHGVETEVTAARVIAVSRDFLLRTYGEQRAKQFLPVSYSRGTIRIVCRSSVAAVDVRIQEEALLRELRQHFPGQPFTRIAVDVRPAG